MNATDLLENHSDALYAFARTRLDSDDDVKDCIQETLLAALKNAGTFAGRSSERTWLIGILKFKIIDLYRLRSREVKNQATDHTDDEGYFDANGHWEMERVPKAWEKSPLEMLEAEELRKYLYACIGKLPAAMRSAVVMREFDREETGEICKRLSVTATNLNVMLYRARMHLRSCLEAAGFRGAGVG